MNTRTDPRHGTIKTLAGNRIIYSYHGTPWRHPLTGRPVVSETYTYADEDTARRAFYFGFTSTDTTKET